MPPLTHEECLRLVSEVCTNLRGSKAKRGVSEREVDLIRKHVFPGYQKGSIWFPQGLCTSCSADLHVLDNQGEGGDEDKENNVKKRKVNLTLPQDYICDLPIQTRSKTVTTCSCRWCILARLAGMNFRKWKDGLRKKITGNPCITYICKECGKGVGSTVKKHTCHASDLDRVRALVESIPASVKAKLTLALIRDQQETACSSSFSLPQPQGGKKVQVTVGPQPVQPKLKPLSLKEVQVMAGKAHLTGEQQKSVMGDLRAKFGKNVVEPGMKVALPIHNKKFARFFTVEKRSFLTSDGVLEEKHLFFCHSPVEFLQEVDRERGRQSMDQITLVQGDSGQGYTKIAVSRLSVKELEDEQYTKIPGAGHVYLETEEEESRRRKRRRSREDGIEGGDQFEDWGARKIFILAVVYKVQENGYNLDTILKAIKIDQLKFKLTGDFAFFMPCLGLLKGCGSSNPCPICDQERSKEGGDGAKWVDQADVNLRTFGSLCGNFLSWTMEGERSEAVHTKKWKSVTGPVLIMGVGDTHETLVLDKLVPGPLHLYLSANELINHCEKKCWPELKSVIETVVGVKAHVYQGKVGNYEGPSIRKIFRKLGTLKPFMQEGDKKLYYDTFVAFKIVSQSVFGKQLHPLWREHLHCLRACMEILVMTQGMPITPKFHVLTVHVEQWIDRNRRALGKESESPGEALHHFWKRLVEGKGEVKVKESVAYVKSTMQSLLKFNADNV